jgi:riboflavin kinase/FMN adenylyltransferase
MKLKGTVLTGDKTGRTIGFPTINLDPSILPAEHKTGIYASWVSYGGTDYVGALYFGPRLVKNEEKNVLEIHILNFDEEIYDQSIEFEIVKHIRDIKNFDSLEELKMEIDNDVRLIKQLLDK